MAWNIPKELMRNNPLSEEEVRKRFEERGYQIIDYIYKIIILEFHVMMQMDI